MLIATLAFLASAFQPSGDAANANVTPRDAAPKATSRPEGAPASGGGGWASAPTAATQ